jgi:hypothetical protein
MGSEVYFVWNAGVTFSQTNVENSVVIIYSGRSLCQQDHIVSTLSRVQP